MKRVIIESPYAGDVDENVAYARSCLRDSLERGEAPFASHLLYTQVLDDLGPVERALGIEAGLAWGAQADLTAVYLDRGLSQGMIIGIERAVRESRAIVARSLTLPRNAPVHTAWPQSNAKLAEDLEQFYEVLTSARSSLPTSKEPELSIVPRILEALADRGVLDARAIRDGIEAEISVGGAVVFVYVDKTQIGLRRANSFDWVRLQPKSTASAVAEAALRLVKSG